uniref:SET domain-containing protein n=1 Tax=Caenorhabditis tropicalis TaxID=1561998 RepID=A0A1I7U4E5_9PELO
MVTTEELVRLVQDGDSSEDENDDPHGTENRRNSGESEEEEVIEVPRGGVYGKSDKDRPKPADEEPNRISDNDARSQRGGGGVSPNRQEIMPMRETQNTMRLRNDSAKMAGKESESDKESNGNLNTMRLRSKTDDSAGNESDKEIILTRRSASALSRPRSSNGKFVNRKRSAKIVVAEGEIPESPRITRSRRLSETSKRVRSRSESSVAPSPIKLRNRVRKCSESAQAPPAKRSNSTPSKGKKRNNENSIPIGEPIRKYPKRGVNKEEEDPRRGATYEGEEEKGRKQKIDIQEVDENLIHRPTVLVVDNKISKSYMISDRIKAISKFNFLVPRICTEARKGDLHGEWSRKVEKMQWPGIPKNKFSLSQQRTDWGTNPENEWLVQGLFEDFQSTDSKKYRVLYEGWTCLSTALTDKTEIEETAPDMVKLLNVKNTFTAKVEQIFKKQGREFHHEKIVWGVPDSPFWLWQDLSYFHSMLHKEQGLAPIWYQYSMRGTIKPPRFAYTPINVVQIDVIRMCRKRIENKTFNELIKWRNIGCYRNMKTIQNQACENKEHCVCDRRYTLLHGNSNAYNGHRFSRNVVVLPDGRIDLNSFRKSDARIVYECSDRCGCSWKCPRRQLQRGQQKPLFGTEDGRDRRAKEIAEKKKGKSAASAEEKQIEKDLGEENLEASYEADFKVLEHPLVISAKFVGNVARFINHSCNPNTRFMETYSRRFENDPLIPRIAVYAVEDIELGEEVTCNYYDSRDAPERQRESVKCLCNTTPCMKYLPLG